MDTHTVRINIEGINYDLSIDNPKGNNERGPKRETQRSMGTYANENPKRVVEDNDLSNHQTQLFRKRWEAIQE